MGIGVKLYGDTYISAIFGSTEGGTGGADMPTERGRAELGGIDQSTGDDLRATALYLVELANRQQYRPIGVEDDAS